MRFLAAIVLIGLVYADEVWAQSQARNARTLDPGAGEMMSLIVFVGVLAAMLGLALWLLRRSRRADLALGEARAMTQHLLGNLREHFIYRQNPDRKFTYVSPSVESILGYSTEDFMQSYVDFLTDHPNNIAAQDHTRRGMRGERQPAYHVEILAHNGRKHMLRISEAPVFNDKGHVVAVEGVAQDVTREAALNARLREQAIAMEEVLAGTGAGSWIWDVESGAFTIDQRFADICGVKTTPAGVWTIEDARLLFGAAPPGDPDPLAAAATEDEPGVVRERVAEVIASDGDSVWVAMRGRLSTQGERRISGTIIAITSRVKEEDALRQAKAEAEKANEAKSRFLAAMSHDLRTPLNAIIGFAELIRAETFGPLGDPRYGEYLEDIHQSGHLLLSLINDILDLSKIESGKYVIAPEPIDLADFARSAVRRISGFAGREGVRVVSAIADGGPVLWADERAMTQIFNNLLSNAVKFSAAGDSVTLTAAWQEDGAFEIAFADQGIGMTPADMAIALEPFEQARAGREGPHKGSGLGLAICTRLMALHGGTLKIDSVPGVGTTVRLCFPDFRMVAPNAADAPTVMH